MSDLYRLNSDIHPDPYEGEHKDHWGSCFVPVELDPVTRWCFAHQEEVFTEIGTDKLICAKHLRSPCDIDDAAVIRIGEET